MSSRPLTPPCVPFGTRRFNRISALARTVSGYCSIQHGRVFLLRDLPVQSASQHIANMPFEFLLLSMPFVSALPALSSSLLWFWASSIVSRYTFETSGGATRPICASLSSCSLSRSSPAIPGCRLLRSPSLSGHFCRMSGKSVLSVWPWLSSDSTSRWTPLPLAKSSRYRATSGLSPYRTCAHRAHINVKARFA